MSRVIKESKLEYGTRLNGLLDSYQKIVFCRMDNVRSQQIHNVRNELRGNAELLMGKKTLQKKIIALRAEQEDSSKNDKTLATRLCEEEMLCGNLGLVFTNANLEDISSVLKKNRVQAPARVGAIAPCDVIVPAGNTGLEPTMTSFFQALNVPTKIAKGTVEIMSDKKVLSTGDRVDAGAAALLQKLKISPFYYAMEVDFVYDRGTIFTEEDLALNDEAIEGLMLSGIANLTALSIGAGVPTEASFPIMVTDAFKSLLAVAVETEYSFSEYNGEQLRLDAKAGKLGGGAAAPAAGAAAAPAAAAAAAPVEESDDDDDMGMGGLF